jgi:5-formyltetrahydrofolate cyclo-ligase
MDKNALREQARDHRRTIDPNSENSENLFQIFMDEVAPTKDKIISVYWPIGTELDTRFLIDDLIREGFKVALPVTPKKTEDYGGRALSFRLWDGKGELIEGNAKTFIPPEGQDVDPDIFLIPLLAFDRKGNRMGYGQGHYDNTLIVARKHKEILAIGVGYAQQAVLFDLVTEPHDQKLDMVLTPVQFFDFR